MKRIALTITAIISLTTIYPIDIEDIIVNHPLYLSADAQVKAAQLGLDKEYMFYYPFGGNLEVENNSLVDNSELNLTVGFSFRYTIFNPDLTKRLKGKKLLVKTSLEYKESVYQLLKYKINKLALNYLNSKDIYKQTKENYESIENYTLNLKKRFSTGDLSKSEVSYAESILLKNRAILLDSEEALKKSLRLFRLETGIEGEEPNTFSDFDIVKEVDIEEVILKDPKIKQATLILLNTKDNIRFTRSNTFPDITLKSSVSYPLDSDSYWDAGIDISIPMFGIKYDNKAKNEYRNELESKENQLDILIRDKKNRIANTLERTETVKEKLLLYKASLELSKESLEGILTEARVGVRTVFDVINAKNSISDIDRYIVESENELKLLKLEYKYQTGGFKSNEN